jgi:hypothetical protein
MVEPICQNTYPSGSEEQGSEHARWVPMVEERGKKKEMEGVGLS